jgi:hypothetical protein
MKKINKILAWTMVFNGFIIPEITLSNSISIQEGQNEVHNLIYFCGIVGLIYFFMDKVINGFGNSLNDIQEQAIIEKTDDKHSTIISLPKIPQRQKYIKNKDKKKLKIILDKEIQQGITIESLSQQFNKIQNYTIKKISNVIEIKKRDGYLYLTTNRVLMGYEFKENKIKIIFLNSIEVLQDNDETLKKIINDDKIYDFFKSKTKEGDEIENVDTSKLQFINILLKQLEE